MLPAPLVKKYEPASFTLIFHENRSTNGAHYTPGGSGWPCRDQIGRSNDNPYPKLQDSVPFYAWGLYRNGVKDSINVNTPHIQPNRDYVNGVSPSYYAYTYPHPITGLPSSMTVLSVGPSLGADSASYSINGSGFGATQGNGYVHIGTTDAVIRSWSDNQIRFSSPPKAFGTFTVYVVNNDMQVDRGVSIAIVFCLAPEATTKATGAIICQHGTSVIVTFPSSIQPQGLIIVDLSGQKIFTLYDARQNAGSRAFTWHANGMRSGVYCCRFTSSNALVMMKFLIK